LVKRHYTYGKNGERAAQNMRNQDTQTVMVQQQTEWHKPSISWFNCNVDAGFHNVEGKTSLGW
jgi:hypothetical protein